MACYLDTSVMVALCTHEAASERTGQWYSNFADPLVSSVWSVTEFASALSLKRRTGQLDEDQASEAWALFERLCASDIHLLPMEPKTFHDAALLTMRPKSNLRAGDALHLACARHEGITRLATLDRVMADHAKALKIRSLL